MIERNRLLLNLSLLHLRGPMSMIFKFLLSSWVSGYQSDVLIQVPWPTSRTANRGDHVSTFAIVL